MILPRRPRRVRPGQRAVTIALYLNVGLLALIAVALLTRDGSISLLPTARAADMPAMGGGGNLYLIAGQFSERTYGCYLMDTDAQTLCVYRFDGAASKLKLIAARNFRHDRRLGHVNTEPDPKEVEVMVETERGGRKAGAIDGPAPAAPSDTPKSRGNPN
jgi:hypothetical protein